MHSKTSAGVRDCRKIGDKPREINRKRELNNLEKEVLQLKKSINQQ